MKKFHFQNPWIFLWTMFLVIPILGLKVFVHLENWEFFVMNPIFSGIIAACFFLMGFLLTGVLADYKESERIPDEVAASIWNIYVDLTYLFDKKKIDSVRTTMKEMHTFAQSYYNWFFEKESSTQIRKRIIELNGLFDQFESSTQTLYVHRLKTELAVLNKITFRVDTIRDTNFISSGYHIAIFITMVICVGLVFSEIHPFYEGLFFIGLISFVMIFMICLIHAIDDPFEYKNHQSAENVSLEPIEIAIKEIKAENELRKIN